MKQPHSLPHTPGSAAARFHAFDLLATLIAVVRNDGVVVFANAAVHNIEMAIASDGGRRWFTRGFGYWAYRYPFIQLGKARVTVRIRADNAESIELCTRLGHMQEGVIRRDHGDTDSLVMGMVAQECRWIKEHSRGKEIWT